jgi:signal transduction histidine kinase
MRLLGILLVSLLVMFFYLWWGINQALQDLTASYLENRMSADIESILAELQVDAQDYLVIDNKHVDRLFHFTFTGYYYQIHLKGHGKTQTLRSQSLGEFVLDTPAVRVGETKRLHATGPKGENLLMFVRAIPLREQTLTILVAEDLTTVEEDREAFQAYYRWIALLSLVCLTLLHGVAVYRALAPLEQVRRDVIRLEQGTITELPEDVPLEIHGLVMQINHLMNRIHQRMERSRNTMSNLAHAMKTPITRLAQIASHPVLAADPALGNEMRERIAILTDMIERALRRARLADHPVPGHFFDPERNLDALVRTLKNIYFQKKVHVAIHGAHDTELPFDQEDMMELFGTLLDNAFKWTTEQVVVQLTKSAEGYGITVEDNGPGVSPELRQHLTDRGVRLDESRSGHGIGLAVAREIVEHYHGQIGFDQSPRLGGLQVTVHLPAPTRRNSVATRNSY